MTDIRGPDGNLYRFPDNMSKDEIKGVMRKKFGGPDAPAPDAKGGQPQAQQGFFGHLRESATEAVKSAIPLYGAIEGAAKNPDAVRQVSEGMAFGYGDEGAAAIEAALGDPKSGKFFDYSRPFGERYQSGVEQEQAAREGFAERNPKTATALEIGGALGTAGGLGRAGLTVMGKGGTTAGRAGLAGVEGGTYGGLYGSGKAPPGQRAEGGAMGAATGFMTGAVASPAIDKITKALGKAGTSRALIRNMPEVDDLKAQAGEIYDSLDQSGFRLPGEAVTTLHNSFRDVLRRRNVLTPKGRIAGGESYAKIRHVLNLAEDYADEGMTAGQIKEVRRTLMDAASQPGTEGNIARELVGAFDDFAGPIAPQIKQANALYHSAMKAERLANLAEIAESRAKANYSGANYETALRQEFAKLHRRIIKGKEKGWTPDEVAAIKRVGDSGRLEELMRFIGKYAPHGVVSTSAGIGTGAYLGSLAGSTGVGAAATGALMGAGAGARAGANAMQRNKAAIAQALTAQGGRMPQAGQALAPAQREALVRALSAYSGGATGQKMPVPVR